MSRRELFLLQAQQAKKINGERPVTIKSRNIDKLHAARLFVRKHMLESVTLAQVGRESGLNEFKLKKVFKELYGSTFWVI